MTPDNQNKRIRIMLVLNCVAFAIAGANIISAAYANDRSASARAMLTEASASLAHANAVLEQAKAARKQECAELMTPPPAPSEGAAPAPSEGPPNPRDRVVHWSIKDMRVGVATVFGGTATDHLDNPDDRLACAWPVWGIRNRRLQPDDLVVATYVLPCGTNVLLHLPRTNKSVMALVGDRGPGRTKHNPELRQTDLDISEAAAKALGHNGKEEIVWGVVK